MLFLYTPWRHTGNLRIAPLILNLSTRQRWVAGLTPRPLYPLGKRLQYPLNWRLGEHQSPSGHFQEKKNILHLQGFEPRIVQPVPNHQTVYTKPARFLNTAFIFNVFNPHRTFNYAVKVLATRVQNYESRASIYGFYCNWILGARVAQPM